MEKLLILELEQEKIQDEPGTPSRAKNQGSGQKKQKDGECQRGTSAN